MDRINRLKLRMKKLKDRNFSQKQSVVSKDRKDWRRAYDCERVKKIYRQRKLQGFCERCNTPAVLMVYEYEGKRLLTRRSALCPKHWGSQILRKEMLHAISTNTTIHTVHPMVSHGLKSNASHTS